jgi:hypothetical protein
MRRFAVFSVVVLATVALVDPIGRDRTEHIVIWWVQGVAAFLAAIVLCLYWRLYYVQVIRPPKPRTIDDIAAVPESEAYELQKVASKIRMNGLQARILALAILEPGELRQRVVEHYRPNQRTLEQEVAVEVKVPMRLLLPRAGLNETVGESDATAAKKAADSVYAEADLLFPVLVIPKGVFTDNLEVVGADGERVPILTYREYLQVTARMLRLLLCLAYGISTANDVPRFPQVEEPALDHNPLHVEHRALCEIIKRAQANVSVKQVLGISPVSGKALDVARLLEELPIPDPSGQIYLQMAAALVRKLSLHYALVAALDLPTDRRLLIRYRRTLIPELELRSDGEAADPNLLKRTYRRLKGWLRVLLGSRPVNVTVSLDNAWTCRSYHVRVDAPEGLYLARQRLIASEDYLAQKAEDAPTPVHYRFRRRLGQSYAHFYGRFFPIPLKNERRPKIQLDFHEVPPGSDFRAAIASAAAFGLIWVVGFVLSRKGNPGTDAPALLLVFPGIAASWLGFDTITHRLFEGTLAARLSLALTTLISLGASGAFILSQSGLSRFYGPVPDGVSVLGVYRWPWAILTVVAFANTLYMAFRWLRHSWQFKHLAERPDPDQETVIDRVMFQTYDR